MRRFSRTHYRAERGAPLPAQRERIPIMAPSNRIVLDLAVVHGKPVAVGTCPRVAINMSMPSHSAGPSGRHQTACCKLINSLKIKHVMSPRWPVCHEAFERDRGKSNVLDNLQRTGHRRLYGRDNCEGPCEYAQLQANRRRRCRRARLQFIKHYRPIPFSLASHRHGPR
jgi:hypothetical protein